MNTAIAPAMDHVIKPTTDRERNLLAAAGFVHVTGLSPKSLAYNDDAGQIGHDLRPRDLGRFGSNNGMDVIITTGGEVWLGSFTDAHITRLRDQGSLRELLDMVCPNGDGAWVPCSNGEQLNFHDILRRVADPTYEPRR